MKDSDKKLNEVINVLKNAGGAHSDDLLEATTSAVKYLEEYKQLLDDERCSLKKHTIILLERRFDNIQDEFVKMINKLAQIDIEEIKGEE